VHRDQRSRRLAPGVYRGAAAWAPLGRRRAR